MEITEQTDNRLQVTTDASYWAIAYGLFVLIFGLLLITGTFTFESSKSSSVALGSICLVYALIAALTFGHSSLVIDKLAGSLTIRKTYVFGLIVKTRNMPVADIQNIKIKYVSGYKGPSRIRLIFKGNGKKLKLSTSKLHFGPDAGTFKLPQNSLEAGCVAVIANFLGSQIS